MLMVNPISMDDLKVLRKPPYHKYIFPAPKKAGWRRQGAAGTRGKKLKTKRTIGWPTCSYGPSYTSYKYE